MTFSAYPRYCLLILGSLALAGSVTAESSPVGPSAGSPASRPARLGPGSPGHTGTHCSISCPDYWFGSGHGMAVYCVAQSRYDRERERERKSVCVCVLKAILRVRSVLVCGSETNQSSPLWASCCCCFSPDRTIWLGPHQPALPPLPSPAPPPPPCPTQRRELIAGWPVL